MIEYFTSNRNAPRVIDTAKGPRNAYVFHGNDDMSRLPSNDSCDRRGVVFSLAKKNGNNMENQLLFAVLSLDRYSEQRGTCLSHIKMSPCKIIQESRIFENRPDVPRRVGLPADTWKRCLPTTQSYGCRIFRTMAWDCGWQTNHPRCGLVRLQRKSNTNITTTYCLHPIIQLGNLGKTDNAQCFFGASTCSYSLVFPPSRAQPDNEPSVWLRVCQDTMSWVRDNNTTLYRKCALSIMKNISRQWHFAHRFGHQERSD